MWELKLIQSYFDTEDLWAGIGYPVSLQSNFGDTESVLKEIREFLEEQNDSEPLAVELDEVEFLWTKAKKDIRQTVELTLRTNDYQDSNEYNDEFEGTVRLQLSASYSMEKAKEKQTPQQGTPQPEPEQLNLF